MAVDGHVFGGGVADFLVVPGSGGVLLLAAHKPVWFYNSQFGGTRVETGLTDMTGAPITEVPSDDKGALPQFRGPKNVTELWADASEGEGPRRLLVANDLGDKVTEIKTEMGSLAAAAADLSAAPAWVRRDPVTGAWPVRPETARCVIWLDTLPETPAQPQIGGAGMVDLDLYFGLA